MLLNLWSVQNVSQGYDSSEWGYPRHIKIKSGSLSQVLGVWMTTWWLPISSTDMFQLSVNCRNQKFLIFPDFNLNGSGIDFYSQKNSPVPDFSILSSCCYQCKYCVKHDLIGRFDCHMIQIVNHISISSR